MDKEKRKRLEQAGWKIGDVQEFLGLSDQEMAYIDLKLTLTQLLRKERAKSNLTQKELASRLDSSPSRVTKMELEHPNVSLDLIIKALLALDVSWETIGENVKVLKERSKEKDWWNIISEAERAGIDRGLADSEADRTTSHQEVRKTYEKWL